MTHNYFSCWILGLDISCGKARSSIVKKKQKSTSM
jgi:hypothetical protein